MIQHQHSGLAPEALQIFMAGLAGMPPEETRKAKLLFIRNEISRLRALKTSMAGFGVAQGCFMLIPIFWPILWAQRSSMKAALTMHAEQIRNALSVWGEDLGADAVSLEAELSTLLR